MQGEHGLMILLVTSRETGRWVLPKGWVKKKRTPAETAAEEAFEEAGLVGDIADTPIGIYHYAKGLPDGQSVDCAVEVYSLQVRQTLADWPERAQRQRRWFTPAEAAELVREPELRTLLRSLGTADNHHRG